MTAIKAGDLAYVRLQVPDVARSAEFLSDFGLLEVPAPGDGVRYYRGTDATPYCYALSEGPERFLGFAFDVEDAAVLDQVAATNGLTVETSNAPGGGRHVRLREPNGYAVDLIGGRAAADPVPIERQLLNSGAHPLLRKGELYRVKRGEIVPVKRLAHVVLGSPDVPGTVRWFQETLGLLISDEIVAGPDQAMMGAFMRIDAGEAFVDHHTVFVVTSPTAGLHHISFESQDVDALLAEHMRLKANGGYEHAWGIGRHHLGSQIFDYWSDPSGYLHEHWADSDRLNAETLPNRWDVHEGMIVQWGEPTPPRVRQATRP